MIGPTKANYSQYTCYTGISDFTPADIDVGEARAFGRCLPSLSCLLRVPCTPSPT